MRRCLLACLVLLLTVLPCVARADGVLPSQATPVQREQAQSRFRRGKELMAKGQYDQAAVEFRASHEIVASPNTRLEVGRCMRAQGHLVAAYAELGSTMVEAKEVLGEDQRYQRAYDAAVAERAQLEPKLGFVLLTLDNAVESTRVVVGDEEIRRAAWGEPAPVEAGRTQVRVETVGRAPVVRVVTVAAGDKTTLRVDAQSGEPLAGEATPETASASGDRVHVALPPLWPAYAGYGVAATTLVAGLYVGVASVSSARENANSTAASVTNAGGSCPSTSPRFATACQDNANDISLIQTDKTVAYAFVVTGAVLAAGSTVWLVYVLRQHHQEQMSEPSSGASVAVTPLVGRGTAGAVVTGAF